VGKQLNVIISTKQERPGLPPSRTLVENAWVYWWVDNTELLLRANATGRVMALTSGPPNQPQSYQTLFTVDEDTAVSAAFSVATNPLARGDVEPQLEGRLVKESLSAALASIGSVSVPANGQTTVTVLPLAEIKLGPAIEALTGDEISLISTYPAPWDGNLRAEIKAATQDLTWHPGTVSFRAVANTPNRGQARTILKDVQTFADMLNLIRGRPKNSIRRLNIFAHANPGLIGLSGSMSGTTITMVGSLFNEDRQRIAGGIDSEAVAFLDFDEEGKRVRDDLRTRFIKQAEILLFLCNGGLGRGLSLAQDLAQAFNVRVLAYNDPVGYYVEFPGGKANRDLTSRGLLTLDDPGFAAAKAAGTIAPGYPFAITAPASVPQGLHLKPDKIVPKPKKPFP